MIYCTSSRAMQLKIDKLENNPFIAWDNLIEGATLSGTSTLAGGGASNVLGGTADFWLPDVTGSTATLDIDLGSAQSVRCAALAAHNLSTYGTTVTVAYSSDDVTYTTAHSATPSDETPVFLRFGLQSARYWRFTFSGLTSGDDLAVGIAFLGQEMILPQRTFQNHTPIIKPNIVKLNSNVSEGGHLMGTSVTTAGSKGALQIEHLKPDFIRGENFLGLIDHFNMGGGILFAWRPEKFPQDVYFGWRDGAVIEPQHVGVRDYMSFSMPVRVYNDR